MSGVYIHIPFCHSKCAYCDFYSMPVTSCQGNDVMSRYVDALAREWAIRSSEIGHDAPATVYIGGGTPSVMPVGELQRLIDMVAAGRPMREITVEANPEDVVSHRFMPPPEWRISMGVQSLHDNELMAVGRRHSAAQALRAIDMLRRQGITRISCDLIYGLPGQTIDSWTDSLCRILDLRIPHLSAYCLSYELGTRLYARRMAGKCKELSDDTLADMYAILCRKTSQAGYLHYEISNFALPGCEAVHNSGYWDFTPYVGLGPGAHSFDGNVRRAVPSDLSRYFAALSRGESPAVVESDTVTDRINDYIITTLRTMRGLSFHDMQRRFGPDAVSRFRHRIKPCLRSGSMVECGSDCVRITEDAWFVSDSVFVDIME